MVCLCIAFLMFVFFMCLLIACSCLLQGACMIFPRANDWPTAIELEVFPCSPLKPELQHEKIDEVYKEAFDELLT